VRAIRSHNHVGSRALGEVRHCFVDVFLWQLFPDGLQLQDSRLRLRLEFMVLYLHGAPDVIVQWFKCGELEGYSVWNT